MKKDWHCCEIAGRVTVILVTTIRGIDYCHAFEVADDEIADSIGEYRANMAKEKRLHD